MEGRCWARFLVVCCCIFEVEIVLLLGQWAVCVFLIRHLRCGLWNYDYCSKEEIISVEANNATGAPHLANHREAVTDRVLSRDRQFLFGICLQRTDLCRARHRVIDDVMELC